MITMKTTTTITVTHEDRAMQIVAEGGSTLVHCTRTLEGKPDGATTLDYKVEQGGRADKITRIARYVAEALHVPEGSEQDTLVHDIFAYLNLALA